MARANDLDERCLTCKKSIEDNEKESVLKCCECHFCYHLGACSGTNESTFRGKKTGCKETWKCQTCRGAKVRTRSNTDDTTNIQKQLTEMTRMLAVLTPLKQQVDELMTVKQTVLDIEKSMQTMSDKYDEVLKKMMEQDTEIKELKKRITVLEKEKATDETSQLRKDLNRLEQYGRMNNLEVHWLVQTQNENLLEKLNQIADKIEVPRLKVDSVEAVHRVPNKGSKTPMVIVRFINRNDRNVWLRNKSKLRGGDDTGTIFIQENMTAQNRKTFFEARAKAKSMGYKFIWHKEGCTYVRKEEGAPTIRIENEGDQVKIK